MFSISWSKPRAAVALLVICWLFGCATSTQLTDPRTAIVQSLAGEWSNSAQYAQAPAALKVPPSVAGDWLDFQHAFFVPINAPIIGDRVMYLEWRSGGKEGAISRQRIWSFRQDADGTVRMDFYAFVDGKPWVGKVNAAEAMTAFKDLTPGQLRGYARECALRFQRGASRTSSGVINASECSLTAASGRRMGINATVSLRQDDTLEYKESGVLEDGRFAFRVPPSEPYRFKRIAAIN